MQRNVNMWCALGTVVLIGVVGTSGQEFELARHTMDGGGVLSSTGSDFELSGTIGQPDAGMMSGGEFELSGGFWFPLAPSDCNEDGCVNLYDYDALESCLAGPGGGLLMSECNCFDLDADNDVDLTDAARLQEEFTGPSKPHDIEICDNGIDDDSDGYVDCCDWDCDDDPGCTSEQVCDNEVDDDCDGFVDCDDWDCDEDPACTR